MAHAFATRVRSSISIRFEAHALPPRVYTSRSKECANVLRASSTRLEKKYTPPIISANLSHPDNILIYPTDLSGPERERGGKSYFSKKISEKSFQFSHVEIRSSVSEYSLSSRLVSFPFPDPRGTFPRDEKRIVERHRIRKVVGALEARRGTG